MAPAALALLTWIAAAPQAAPAPAPSPGTGAAHHARAASDVFRVQALGGGVHVLYGRGGNVAFYVGPDAVLVVDSQFRDVAPGILEQIKKVTDKPVRYLVNTHHHGDHVGGNEAFKPVAVIMAHENVRKRMLAAPAEVLRDYPARLDEARATGNEAQAKFLAEQIEWAKKVRVETIPAPSVTYGSELKVHLGWETIHLWHTPPAHTDGDTVVSFEAAKVVHLGDLLFHKVIPVIDPKAGATVKGYVAALGQVMDRLAPDTTVIPGHGEVTDVQGVIGFNQYITDLLQAARQARKAGKSKEAFVAEVDLPDYKDWRGYPERFKANAAVAWDEAE